MPQTQLPPPIAQFNSVPKGLFTFNREIHGDGHYANLELRTFRNEGVLEVDGNSYEIDKPKMLQDRFMVQHETGTIVEAARITTITRNYEILDHFGAHEFTRKEMFSRTFVLKRDGHIVAEFGYDGWFTRKMFIRTYTEEIEFVTLAFCNWLLMLFSRRDSQSSST